MGTRPDFSSRLNAVLDRLEESDVRISNALETASIFTVTKLVGMSRSDLLKTRSLGERHVSRIEDALAHFGLSLAGATAIVVRDGGTALEANAEQLQKWIVERLRWCESQYPSPHALTEQETLSDVFAILDGRDETMGERSWALNGDAKHLTDDELRHELQHAMFDTSSVEACRRTELLATELARRSAFNLALAMVTKKAKERE
jgi:hypothetical protein